MSNRQDKRKVGELIYSVLTDKKQVREAIKLFPDSKDKNIVCAYHALVHFEADEDIRRIDIEYREAQDEYMEMLAQTLYAGKDLPQNIINEYKPYYKDKTSLWIGGIKGFICAIKKFINI